MNHISQYSKRIADEIVDATSFADVYDIVELVLVIDAFSHGPGAQAMLAKHRKDAGWKRVNPIWSLMPSTPEGRLEAFEKARKLMASVPETAQDIAWFIDWAHTPNTMAFEVAIKAHLIAAMDAIQPIAGCPWPDSVDTSPLPVALYNRLFQLIERTTVEWLYHHENIPPFWLQPTA